MTPIPYVVFNPASGRGRGSRLIGPVLQALGGGVGHGVSRAPGEEVALTERAIAEGCRTLVAVGGDGTWGNVAGAILRSGQPVRLGLVPGGTGSDFAKSLGIPDDDVPACARIVREGHERLIDVGKIEDHYFLNIAGFGFDVAVIEDSRAARLLRGPLLYLVCALSQLYRYPGLRMGLFVDGVFKGRERILMAVIANARIFGGGFQIAPGAVLDDGLLDGVVVRHAPLHRRLPLLVRLRRGGHEGVTDVSTSRARVYRLTFDAPPAYETDGELNQARANDLTVESLPRALRVLVSSS
jgi:YegS/Rv2252/BmrU family lipid kinase